MNDLLTSLLPSLDFVLSSLLIVGSVIISILAIKFAIKRVFSISHEIDPSPQSYKLGTDRT